MKTPTSRTAIKAAIATTTSALLLAAGAATADIDIVQGTTSAGDTDNVIFNTCVGNITGPGPLVQGCLNTNHSYLINFTSGDTIQADGGQARIEGAGGGTFDDLTIQPTNDDDFAKLSFNIMTSDVDPNGSITIFAFGSEDIQETFAVDGSGSNFFYVIATLGQSIDRVSFSSTVGIDAVLFDDVRQVRIGGGAVPLPEPGALALLGMVLGAVGVTSRRRTRC